MGKVALTYAHLKKYTEAESILLYRYNTIRELNSTQYPPKPQLHSNSGNTSNTVAALPVPPKPSSTSALTSAISSTPTKPSGHNSDDDSLLVALRDLGDLYYKSGSYDKSIHYYNILLTTTVERYGDNHSNIIDIYTVLSHVYNTLCIYDKAEDALTSAYTIQISIYTKYHSNTLTILSALADVIRIQDRASEAHVLYQDCVEVSRTIYTPSTTTSTTTTTDTATESTTTDTTNENPTTDADTTADATDVPGSVDIDSHPVICIYLLKLAHSYRNQCEYTLAEPIYTKILNIYNTIYGKDSLETYELASYLAMIHRCQGRIVASEELYKRTWEACIVNYGEKHTRTLTIQYDYASLLYNSLHNYTLALTYYNYILTSYEEIYGIHHINTINIRHHISSLYIDLNHDLEGKRLIVICYDRCLEYLGLSHAKTLAVIIDYIAILQPTYDNMCSVKSNDNNNDTVYVADSADQSDNDSSSISSITTYGVLLKQLYDIYQVNLGHAHAKTLHTEDRLIVYYTQQQQYDEAEGLYTGRLDRARVVGLKGEGQGQEGVIKSVKDLIVFYKQAISTLSNTTTPSDTENNTCTTACLPISTNPVIVEASHKAAVRVPVTDALLPTADVAASDDVILQAPEPIVSARSTTISGYRTALENIYLELLSINRSIYDLNTPNVCSSASSSPAALDELISVYKDIIHLYEYILIQPERAEQYYVHILDFYKAIYDADNEYILLYTKDLALYYARYKQYDSAEPILIELLSIYKRIYGDNSDQTLGLLTVLGQFYAESGRPDPNQIKGKKKPQAGTKK